VSKLRLMEITAELANETVQATTKRYPKASLTYVGSTASTKSRSIASSPELRCVVKTGQLQLGQRASGTRN
jgi:hypothetical protein